MQSNILKIKTVLFLILFTHMIYNITCLDLITAELETGYSEYRLSVRGSYSDLTVIWVVCEYKRPFYT